MIECAKHPNPYRDISPKTKRRMCLGCVRFVVVFSSLALLASAEVPRDATAWIDELSATHAELDGFIATYVAEGENKRLDATLAMDRETGLGAASILAFNDGEEVINTKYWNTLEDNVFYDMEGEIRMLSGLNAKKSQLMTDLSELIKLLSGNEDAGKEWNMLPGWQPGLLLESAGIAAVFELNTEGKPSWASAVEEASVHEFDDFSVTFSTASYGLLTISREHGLLVRQFIKGLDGEDRILEIRDLVKNPGQKKVAALSSEWPIEDPQVMRNDMTTAFGEMRAMAFQLILNMVGEGSVSVEEVEKLLEIQWMPLKRIVDSWVMEEPRYFESDEIWNVLFGRFKADVEDELWESDVDLEGGVAVERFLRVGENRERLRGRSYAMIEERMDLLVQVIDEIFMGAKFKGHNEDSKKAAGIIMTKLTQAYVEAIFDRKANEKWGPVDGT